MRALLLLALLPAPAFALSPKAQEGRAVMQAAQCNRCHRITDAAQGGHGIAPAARGMHCVDCHTWILGTRGDAQAIAAARVDFPDWDRYLENIEHFTRLPDLGTLTRRVRPDFLRRFLDGPFDLRPHLDESMIPLRLTAAQKDAVVAYLTEINGARVARGDRGPQPTPAHIEAGKARFVQRGCPACHVVGNATLLPGLDAATYAKLEMPSSLAPDLRYARDRMPRATLLAYLEDPQGVDPGSAMPKMPLFGDDAERIADYLLFGPIEDGALPGPAFADLPVLQREVTYDEVHAEVLGFVCVHCHMHPESNNGDGGAGNTGGLGYAGVRLDLETYAGVKKGLVRDGERVDVLAPEAPGEPPLLMKALLRRRAEAQRDHRPAMTRSDALGPPTSAARPGMPLGLPPLSAEKLSLVKTWLAQGARGPK